MFGWWFVFLPLVFVFIHRSLSLSLALSLARTLHNCFHVSTEFIPWFDTINTHIWTSLVKFWTIVVIRLFPDRTGQLPNEIFVIVCKLWFGTLVESFICVYKIYLINHDKLKMIATAIEIREWSEQKPKASKNSIPNRKITFLYILFTVWQFIAQPQKTMSYWLELVVWVIDWLIYWAAVRPFTQTPHWHTNTVCTSKQIGTHHKFIACN